MNKPIPALDERGDFIRGTLRRGGTVTIFTLDDGTGDEYPIISDAGAHCSEDFVDIDKLRATVEHARAMRCQRAAVDAALRDGGTGAWLTGTDEYTSFRHGEPTRPTFAEALQEEALLGGDTTMTWSDFVDCVKRARRASEGQL